MTDITVPNCVVKFTFSLGTGSFDKDGSSSAAVSGYRSLVSIQQQGAPESSEATIRIFGLPDSIMNKLSRVGLTANVQRNTIVTIEAGADDDIGTVFTGVIFDAWTDYDDQPNVCFVIEAKTALIAGLTHAQATSYAEKVPVVTVLNQLAGKMGYKLENNLGSNGPMLSHPYYAGSYRSQALSAAQAAGVYVYFEDDSKQLVVYPVDGSRKIPKPTLSPETGLVGYPSYAGPGMIKARTRFNRLIRFGGMITIKSPAAADNAPNPADGDWRAQQITHLISCEMPGGEWFTDVVGLKL